jgi:hypothetical protein
MGKDRKIMSDIKISYELSKFIKSQCEAWADWKRLSEEEQDDTIEGYEKCFIEGWKKSTLNLEKLKAAVHALDISLPAGTWFHLGPYGSSPEKSDYDQACKTFQELKAYLDTQTGVPK